MSGRDNRSSESKRRRSRFDRQPSPKRSRRDGKPETERPPPKPELEKSRSDRDRKHSRRHQDPLSLDSKVESGIHDDRGSVARNGKSFTRRTDNERGWWRDAKEHQNATAINKTVSSNTHQKDEKAKDNIEGPILDARRYDKPERPFAGVREMNRAQSWRRNFASRDGITSSRYRGRDGFSSRQGYGTARGRVEKWKHDLYNRSPTPKNQEDQVSKIEALLAS